MKKSFLFCVALACMIALSCRQVNPILSVEGGRIHGILDDSSSVIVYKGIPYAAPGWPSYTREKPYKKIFDVDNNGY